MPNEREGGPAIDGSATRSVILGTAGLLRPLLALWWVSLLTVSAAEPVVVWKHLGADEASRAWTFDGVPGPSRNDAGRRAEIRLVTGRADPNGAGTAALLDGRVAGHDDVPGACFFLAAGAGGGRLLVDLGRVVNLAQVNTFSWHGGERAPQVYTLFAAEGTEPGLALEPAPDRDPAGAGWRKLADVDTRGAGDRETGGQYAVSVAARDPAEDLGRFRYLLLAIEPVHRRGPFGQTFFTELDAVERGGPAPEPAGDPVREEHRRVVELEGGGRVVIDATEAPDLLEWIDRELVPLVREWYPELARMLPSEGFEAPRRVTVRFAADDQGVAAASGTRITCGARWFRANLSREAKGAVVHELVHVVQQYGSARREAGASRPPGWLVEGLADYLRWFRYEPRSGGAWLTPEAAGRVKYDGSYRITAHFLHWVTQEYGSAVYRGLNAALREGRYREDLWKDLTGKPVEELGELWKADLARQRRD